MFGGVGSQFGWKRMIRTLCVYVWICMCVCVCVSVRASGGVEW